MSWLNNLTTNDFLIILYVSVLGIPFLLYLLGIFRGKILKHLDDKDNDLSDYDNYLK